MSMPEWVVWSSRSRIVSRSGVLLPTATDPTLPNSDVKEGKFNADIIDTLSE